MITQNFIREFEMSLLRSYGLAARQSLQRKEDTSVIGAISMRDYFVKGFMDTFNQKRLLLEREIRDGNNRESAKLFEQIQRMVDAKLRTLLFQKSGKIDERSFQKVVRELKTEIRTVFYESRD